MLYAVVVVAIAAYLAFTASVLYQVVVPQPCGGPNAHCVTPHFAQDQLLDIYVFVSAGPKKKVTTVDGLNKAVARFTNVSPNAGFSEDVVFSPPRAIFNNATIYSHVFITKAGHSIVPGTPGYDKDNVLYARSPLTRHLVPLERGKLLLSGEDDAGNTSGDTGAGDGASHTTSQKGPRGGGDDDSSARSDDHTPLQPQNHLRDHVTLMYVPDDTAYDIRVLPVPLKLVRYKTYHPVVDIADLLVSRRDWRPLDDAVTRDESGQRGNATFTFTFRPTSIGLYRLVITVNQGLGQLRHTLGFTDKDIDDVKALFLNNSLSVLGITYAITILHLIFDYLAFKNDIGFWRGRKHFAGLSRRAVMFQFASTVIIFLYLLDSQQTSMIILGVTGFSVLVEGWKAMKVLRHHTTDSSGSSSSVDDSSEPSLELKTDEYDALAMRYLGWALAPIALAFAAYSLVYTPHRSWYSWALASLAKGVYVFGFIFMTPQLFINYKLKSVAHLPWRALMYKAFNTFIDDVFSFIIAMPTAHRLACLRDDVVFIVYLYQRWLYPVDKSRVNEFGFSYEHTHEEKHQTGGDGADGGSGDAAGDGGGDGSGNGADRDNEGGGYGGEVYGQSGQRDDDDEGGASGVASEGQKKRLRRRHVATQ
ncbi:hypothetical protein PTSG_07768 [Salpingoeca rosetta]|uniref:Uncharacterized protein n=1 Tax=Salpingoeca rosetta (strain ATCC 50818 / BSB-021) TaxID=946362 RepID=F2UGA1_SALR5|nr:uncharacterized protein PTSG_07768 [Salpingoeca rosetta]EGD75651.1 hypothetical protein PTSG_07768 [Salpingoeca rosetta]|eukprot:XP_004991572.1 hypothetical protein PTSG_07768 [Salpingoeca rosetta]